MFEATQQPIPCSSIELPELYLKSVGFKLIKKFWLRGDNEAAVIRKTPSHYKIVIGKQL